MCNSPYSPRARARTLSTDSSACFNSSRTSSRKSFPSAVSVTPRALSRRRSTPISSSRSWICRLNAGCATRSRAAALVKFNASPTARKYRRCRSSTARFYHAGKASRHNKHGIGRIQNAPVITCMIKIGIILGSTRPNRNGEAVAKWVYKVAKKRSDAEFELVDIKDFDLPLLDEPLSPILGTYSKPHTRVWAAKIDSFDAYVFVTPEYNHGISGALKNAIDFLFAEWNNKAAGFVSYGGVSGVRAGEHLRLVLAAEPSGEGRT